jgi:carboxyl-terminal processing protease
MKKSMNARIKKMILGVALCVLAAMSLSATDAKRDTEIVRNLDTFNSLYKELNAFYVDSLDAKKNIETAIGAMLRSIDPYTEYVSANNLDDYRVLSTGEYGGIGSGIISRDGSSYFSEPYEGSPAALAGIRPGDKIVMIDGDSIGSMALDKVSERLKGEQNTTVKVVVDRPYVGNVEMSIVRKKIKQNPVPYYGVQRDSIGYISLTTFNANSAAEVKKALLDLTKNKAVKTIALDLRGNGGGLLESAVQIVGMFVPKGTEVLTQKGRIKQNTRTYKTTQEPVDTKIPLVVLIDGSSASSSEIVAGSLQDLDRAVIVGNRSYGKGLVQTSRPLPYDGILHVTIAKYYIPSGRLIQAIDYSRRKADGSVERIPDSLTNVFHTANGREVRDGGGITPDIEVEYPKVNRLAYNIVRDYWAMDLQQSTEANTKLSLQWNTLR